MNELKRQACEANRELPRRGLVLYSWGNVSLVDRERNLVIIKPAGLPYDELTPEKMNTLTLDGEELEGPYRPSVDIPIHLELYRAFPGVTSIVHTHSTYATIWAQAGKPIPVFGTTHADYFNGPVPCAGIVPEEEVLSDYEAATGRGIISCFSSMNPLEIPGCLAKGHGVFTWGTDVWEAVHNAVVLEEIARMALWTLQLNPQAGPLPDYLLKCHFQRKNGPDAYFQIDDKGARNV